METQERREMLILRKGTKMKNIAALLILGFMVIMSAQTLRAQNAETEYTDEDTTEFDLPPFCRHEFSIWGAGGLSGFNYKPQIGSKELREGGMFGIGYTVFFSRSWGIQIGAELAMYNTVYKLKNLHDVYKTTDPDDLTPNRQGEPIDYHTALQRYEEKQRLYSVNIPLMIQFQTGEVHKFFLAFGAKLGIPIKSWYQASGTVSTWGYYYDEATGTHQILESDNARGFHLEDLGYFDRLEYSSDKQELKFKLTGIASFETGVKWRLSPKVSLYTGAYIDYGFLNMSKDKGRNFFSFNPEQSEMTSNSVLTSQYAHNNTSRYAPNNKEVKDFATKVSPVSFGLKLRFGINLCKMENVKTKNKENACAEQKFNKSCDCNDQDREDPYRKGYRDAYKDLLDIDSTLRRPNKPDENKAMSNDNKTTPYGQQTTSEYDTPFYTSDPLLNAEMKRASAEYGKLADLLVLQIDGYEVNQSKLSPIMERMIDDKIRMLQKYNNDNYLIICEGHTCDLGNEIPNMNLGQMRAIVVKDYLKKRGFNGDNIIPVSKGESTPIVLNNSEFNRKLNRRVVFIMIEKKR